MICMYIIKLQRVHYNNLYWPCGDCNLISLYTGIFYKKNNCTLIMLCTGISSNVACLLLKFNLQG
jgi:hypothetical protein